MKITQTTLLGSLAVALLMAVSYRVGRVRADGAPTMNPLTYGGYLDDGGRPVDGTRSITVRLWDAASGGTAACTTVSPTTPVSAGRWRVTLDPACATTVQTSPNLWAEVIVDSTTFPRAKIGAVPYALEAGRAAGASGPLAARISAVEAAAGPRQVEFGTTTAFGTAPCVSTYQTSTNIPSLTITAAATATYRIATSITFGSSGTGGMFRIASSPALTFLARTQPPYQLPSYTGPIAAYAHLEAGHSYTFSLEYQTSTGGCTVSLSGLSPLVVEQVN